MLKGKLIMSDYIFSSNRQQPDHLTKLIESIYVEAPPSIKEFHGEWGSLAVSKGHYNGFQPYENEEHILIVIGGPVLYFRDNDFLVAADSGEGTKAIYERWIIHDNLIWDKDLSGPFSMILIDKRLNYIDLVTDIMGFIPAYSYEHNDSLFIGTHIDSLASSCEQKECYDHVSLADFVLNDVITFPYTAYKKIFQVLPASIIRFEENRKNSTKSYWKPSEKVLYSSFSEAASYLQVGIGDYVSRVTEKMGRIAQFISAGEDSRALSGMLPSQKERDGYIFLDSINREGKIASKVADAYGINFTIGLRSESHYFDILPEASLLIGSGLQYHHAHSLGYDRKYALSQYDAVFGGYLSDSLLKGVYANKRQGIARFPLFFEVFKGSHKKAEQADNPFFVKEVLDEVEVRRQRHFQMISNLRPKSANEWFVLWPATMRATMSNFHSTRRLFKSYEPFMSNDVVKVSAAVPIEWKLNRRLFNKAMRTNFSSSKWLLHPDGHLPYFSWKVNMPLKISSRIYRKITNILAPEVKHNGPWADWSSLFNSDIWSSIVSQINLESMEIEFLIDNCDIRELLLSDALSDSQRRNLIQLLTHIEHASG